MSDGGSTEAAVAVVGDVVAAFAIVSVIDDDTHDCDEFAPTIQENPDAILQIISMTVDCKG